MLEDMSVEEKLETLRIYCHVLEGFVVALTALELERQGAQKLTPATRKSSVAFLKEALQRMVDNDPLEEKVNGNPG